MARRVDMVMMLALVLPACRAHFERIGDGAPALDVGDGRDGDLVITGNQSTSPCRALLDGSGSMLRFAAVDSLAAGTKLFVWQVQDDRVSTSGETIQVTSPGDAGHWEIVTIESVGGTDVTLTAPLAYAYSSATSTAPARRAQACTIRQYESATVPVGSLLTTPAWNGDGGGVIAMFVRGTLDLGGTIDVGGAGFRGGSGVVSDVCVSTTELDPVDCAGRKGEGLDGAAWGCSGAATARLHAALTCGLAIREATMCA